MDDATTVQALIYGPIVVGLGWSAVCWRKVTNTELDGHQSSRPAGAKEELLSKLFWGKLNPNATERTPEKECGINDPPRNIEDVLHKLKKLSGIVADGAMAFLKYEYAVILAFVIVFSGVVGVFCGVPTIVSFVVGALTSMLCGWIGMQIAVKTNVVTAHASWKSLADGFKVSLEGGCVMGLALVSLGVLCLMLVIVGFKSWNYKNWDEKTMYECIAGYGLGGSTVALFGRVGGGIYTKAADVGADLAGKIGLTDPATGQMIYLDEDSPDNPAVIADNVGDNVGDIAGMGADLFGSFAESTCAALVLAASTDALVGNVKSMMYPILISSTGIIVGFLTLLLVPIFKKIATLESATDINAEVHKKRIQELQGKIDTLKQDKSAGADRSIQAKEKEINLLQSAQETDNPDPAGTVESALKWVLILSTVLMTPVVWGLSSWCLPAKFVVEKKEVQWWYCALSITLGLWSGLIIGLVTEYYTSYSYNPVKGIAKTQKTSAATGIILGLALGYESAIIPTVLLTGSILVAHLYVGMFGIALTALGMLGTMSMGLTIDAYGPISDNAGGLAEMAFHDEVMCVRTRTDCLDAAGNTTAAIGKGFAIGSAALVSLALFGAYTVRADIKNVDILDPWVFTGLILGAMLPYAFAACTMRSVSDAADAMYQECEDQIPKILAVKKLKETGVKVNGYSPEWEPPHLPDYKKCILMSTKASIREMLVPGAMVILGPLVAGLGFGKNACAGMLSGALVSAVQLAISMSNSGGAWDNAKKYIKSGGDGSDEHNKRLDSGKKTHENAVTGDTVGDPLKDTSGPALNIVMKLTAILSLVFGTAIAEHSNADGGPAWLTMASANATEV